MHPDRLFRPSPFILPLRLVPAAIVAVFLCLSLRTPAHAQQQPENAAHSVSAGELSCGMVCPIHDVTPSAKAPEFAIMSSGMIEAHGGAHLPTKGTVRGLVVFVQTYNDAVEHPDWPRGSLPLWSGQYATRLQQYFSDMSNGDMLLQLDVFPDLMTTKYREDDYVEWQQNFGHAVREILDSLDQLLDFADYDLWNSERQPYQVAAGPDGRVDLVIFVFRSVANTSFLPFSGVSDLGFAGYHFLDGSLARWVYGGTGHFNDAASSGITVCRAPGYRIVTDMDFAFRVTVHEFGHKIFGEGHPAELYGSLGVMANAGNGYAMGSFERHLAGYIQYRETIPGLDTTLVLRDYVPSGDAVLIPLPRQPRGYYALEYRTGESEWDSAPVRGLYAYRIYDSWSRNQKYVEVISAEGKFTWALDSATNTVQPLQPAPLTGKSRFQRIPLGGKTYWAEGWWGDPRAAFTPERPHFSVLKNPTPDFLTGGDTVFTDLRVSLLAMDDSTATVRISYQPPVILSASAANDQSFVMAPPFPNPLRSDATGMLPVRLERAGTLRVRLFDALGREVRTLFDAAADAGIHRIPIDARDLAVGLYSIVLESATGSASRTLVVTR